MPCQNVCRATYCFPWWFGLVCAQNLAKKFSPADEKAHSYTVRPTHTLQHTRIKVPAIFLKQQRIEQKNHWEIFLRLWLTKNKWANEWPKLSYRSPSYNSLVLPVVEIYLKVTRSLSYYIPLWEKSLLTKFSLSLSSDNGDNFHLPNYLCRMSNFVYFVSFMGDCMCVFYFVAPLYVLFSLPILDFPFLTLNSFSFCFYTYM